MKTLITGASGLIGSHLCKKLAQEKHSVVALVHKYVNPILLKNNIKLRVCDIRNGNDVRYVVEREKPDIIFHLAAALPHLKDQDFKSTNVIGTHNILKAASDVSSQVVYASSMSVYSSPPKRIPVSENDETESQTEYGKTKLQGESLCAAFGARLYSPKIAILRFASVYGVGDTSRVAANFMNAALKNEPIKIDGDGAQSSDFIYVDDAVQSLILSMNKSGIYNIGSGVETSIKELAQMIKEITKSESEIVVSGEKVDRPFRFAADISKAKNDLGYKPMKIENGLRKYRESINGK